MAKMNGFLLLTIVLFVQNAHGQTTTAIVGQSKLIPFGPGQNDNIMFRGDDQISAPIHIPIRFPFFNHQYDEIKIQINGMILFGNQSYQSIDYKPQRFPVDGIICVAPFWADVLTRDDSISNIFYREITDQLTLTELDRIVANAFPGQSSHRFIWAFVVTWDRVPGYGLSQAYRNTFQAIITTNGINSFTIYNYDRLQWSAGTYSNNIHAQAGFNAGDLRHSFIIDKSFTPQVLSIVSDSNVYFPGRFVFSVGGDIVNVVCNTSDGLQIAPFRGSTHGGYEIRLYGICFNHTDYIIKVDQQIVTGCSITFNYITCLMPMISNGPMINIEILTIGNEFVARTKFLVDIPEDNAELLIENSTATYESLFEMDENDTFTMRFKNDSVTRNYNFSIEISYYETIFTEDYEFVRIVSRQHVLYTSVNLVSLNHLTIRYDDIFQIPTNRLSLDDIKVTVLDIQLKLVINLAPPPIRLAYKLIKKTIKAVKKLRQFCAKWQAKLPQLPAPSTYQSQVPRCPCRVPAIGQNRFPLIFNNFQTDSSCNIHKSNTCKHNLGAVHCYRQSFQPTGPGMKCCYDSNGLILTNPQTGAGGLEVQTKSSGSIIQQIKHTLFDQLPSWACCKLPQIITQIRPESCNQYHQQRPVFSCENIPLPVPSGGNGDPHFITLDGVEYTFNGYGEYVLLRTPSLPDSKSVQVQIRTKSIPSDSEDNQATAIVAFVIKNANYSKVQFELFNQIKLLEIRLNDQPLDTDTFLNPSASGDITEEINQILIALDRTIQFDDNQMSISQTNRTTYKISYSNNVQVIITIREEHDFMNIVTILPKSYEGYCQGLLGNMDGNKTNDFTFQNGQTMLSSTEQNSEERLFVFGESWRVISEKTLFKYTSGQNYQTHQNVHYRPIFREELFERYENTPRLTMATQKCHNIQGQTGQQQCIYDILITNDQTMGDFHQDFQTNINEWQEYAELVHKDELKSLGCNLRIGISYIVATTIIRLFLF